MVTGKPVLLGRRSECELLDCLLEAARHGRGAVLVVRGEPGIGKTALLDYAVHRAQGLRVARVAVAMVFGTREQSGELAGLPELLISGLSTDDSRVLLDSVIAGRLDERVRDQIVAEAHGNPLALLELPRGSTPADLAGGFGMPDVPGVPGRLERSFRGRYQALPALTQRLLLVAAAEPTGDPMLVWEAAGKLGIEPDAAPAEVDELVTFGARVVFRHPLVRSAVYRASSPRDRRAVHRALADSIDAQLDPDRRAWHRAQATIGPDEDIARELESSAGARQFCG